MPPRHSTQETEIKLRVAGAAEGKRLLSAAGFRVARRRVFESNTLFDTADAKLRKTGQVLRVRECGRRVLLTYKGPAVRGRHKSREELEIEGRVRHRVVQRRALGRHLEREDVVRVVARVDVAQLVRAAQQQPRPDQQHERERGLARDQRVAHPAMPTRRAATAFAQPREIRVDAAISNSFGFGGTNVVLAMRRFVG